MVAGAAAATPKIPHDQLVTVPGVPATHVRPDANRAYTVKDATARLALVATFEQSMQVSGTCSDSGACEVGGIREVESGSAYSIVQSDNTQQAVFIWSYQHSLDPMQSHQQQITNAFEYLSLNPGWLEWMDSGGTGPDYYSLYNCGWGMRAVLAYEAATKDMSHHVYGVMCAQHVFDNGLALSKNNNLVDTATAGWGASGLWLWSQANNSFPGLQRASDIGASIKAWLDAKPSRVSAQSWAVTGGAAFDAVMQTYMKDHPAEIDGWLATMAPVIGGWIDESYPENPNDWTDWRNAHVAWNMLAQFDAAAALKGDDADAHRQLALELLDKLWTQDTENDGAIPGSLQRPVTEDESWITAYFTVFGLRQIYDLPTPMPDAGADDGGGDGSMPDAGTMPMKSGGCSCDASNGEGTGASILGALAVLFVRRRRR